MEQSKLTKEKFIKIKDGILFALLLLWMAMPILQTFRKIYDIIDLKEIYFNLMNVIGAVGIGLGTYTVYEKIKKSQNKKETLKELLPIFVFVLYMIWTFISALLARDRYAALEGSFYRKEGYLMYMVYAGFFFCSYLLDSKKLRKILLNILIIASIYLIIMTRATLSGGRYRSIFVNYTIDNAVFSQFNHYGYYLMMALMSSFGLLLTEKNKIVKLLYIVAYSIILYGLIFNNTFGCYLAVFTILILYTIYSIIKKNNIVEIIVALIIFVILSCTVTRQGKIVAYNNISGFISDIKTVVTRLVGVGDKRVEEEEKKLENETTESLENEIENENKNESTYLEDEFEKAGSSRIALWKNGIKFMLEKPIIGYGPENLKIKYQEVGIDQDRPHNLLIQLSTTSGIPGMLLYVTAVGIIVIRGIKKLIQKDENAKLFVAIVVAYLISAMFGNSMFYTSPYFFIFLGSLMNANSCKEEK